MKKFLLTLTILGFLFSAYACGYGCGSCDRGETANKLYIITYNGCITQGLQGVYLADVNGSIHIDCCTGIVSVAQVGS